MYLQVYLYLALLHHWPLKAWVTMLKNNQCLKNSMPQLKERIRYWFLNCWYYPDFHVTMGSSLVRFYPRTTTARNQECNTSLSSTLDPPDTIISYWPCDNFSNYIKALSDVENAGLSTISTSAVYWQVGGRRNEDTKSRTNTYFFYTQLTF